jgi:D-alanine transaminase
LPSSAFSTQLFGGAELFGKRFMPRIAYVNGRYVPVSDAGVSIQDRGFQFADGIYEVIGRRDGALVNLDGHFARLQRSLAAVQMTLPMSLPALHHVLSETVRRNRLGDALLYVQITRGAAPRDHAFPAPDLPQTLVVIAKPFNWAAADARSAAGIAVITMPDLRWKRCDIKSTGLLPAVLAREEARRRGAQETWFLDEKGYVTEGAASNAWIVTDEGRVVTRALSHAILRGVTRDRFLDLMALNNLVLDERAFTRSEALGAKEAFITGATNIATAVVRIDDTPIGSGEPGPVALALRAAYWQRNN